METIRRSVWAVSGIIALAAQAACGSTATDTSSAGELNGNVPEVGKTQPMTPSTALRLEQASRKLEVGRDVAAARREIEAVLLDPAATPGERDEAALSLGKALDLEGDHEGAIKSLEGLIASHTADERWPLRDAAEDRLYELVTGKPHKKRSTALDSDDAVAPFARVLAPYVPESAPGKFDARIIGIGESSQASDRLGTFNVGGAIRELRRKACPLCDEDTSVHSSISRSDSWLTIPSYKTQLASAIAVYYFDLEQNRVPARYDESLPLPSADIVEHLEKGLGMVAARERPGAPPVILIAAPRAAQLAVVEAKLATLTELPVEPVTMKLDPSLQRSEIESTIRGARKAFRACYEELLSRAHDAAGKVLLKLMIDERGHIAEPTAEAETPSLRDGAFQRCTVDATSALAFPTTGAKTTVTYPITFSR